jgi:hypothetical protein
LVHPRVRKRPHAEDWFGKLSLHSKLESIRKKADLALAGSLIESPEQALRRTEHLYLDFLRVFCRMVRHVQRDRDMDKVKNLLGVATRDMIYATEETSMLKQVLPKTLRDTDDRSQWVPEELEYSLQSDPTSTDDCNCKDIIHTWVRFLGVSENTAYAHLLKGAFSDMDLLKIVACLALRALLTAQLSSTFHPILLGDALRGVSQVPRYFDGMLSLDGGTLSASMICLVRSSTLELGVSAISSFCVALEDASTTSEEQLHGILFIPGFPTSDTLRTELYWRDIRHQRITVLYLADFYELFRIFESENILYYLRERADG